MVVNSDTYNLVSKTISNLRFPLMVGVVMMHSTINVTGNIGFIFLQEFLSVKLMLPCVPIFFFLSSFLFFWEIQDLTQKKYFSKIKKRVRSLLVPYVVWNAVTILVFYLIHTFASNLINPDFEPVPQWKVMNYLAAFWNGSGGHPISYQLWFLRDLMILMILAPLFYLAIYKHRVIRWMCMLVIFIMYVFFGGDLWRGIFYFYMGALLAYYMGDDCHLMKVAKKGLFRTDQVTILSGLVFLCLIVVSMTNRYYCLQNEYIQTSVDSLARLSGSIFYLSIFLMITAKGFKVAKCLEDSSFFLYLYHPLVLLASKAVLEKVVHPNTFITLCVGYIGNIILVVSLGVIINYIMKRYTPKLASFLLGGR